MCFLIEGLSFARYYLLEKTTIKLTLSERKKMRADNEVNNVLPFPVHIRIAISLLYLVTVVLSYLIMLMVMNYNVGVFFCTIFGLVTGYFFFGVLKIGMKMKARKELMGQG